MGERSWAPKLGRRYSQGQRTYEDSLRPSMQKEEVVKEDVVPPNPDIAQRAPDPGIVIDVASPATEIFGQKLTLKPHVRDVNGPPAKLIGPHMSTTDLEIKLRPKPADAIPLVVKGIIPKIRKGLRWK